MPLHTYPSWDRYRSIYLKVATIITLIAVIVIFQTEINSKPLISQDLPYEVVDRVLPPPTKQEEKKKVLPPKEIDKVDLVEEIIDEPEFIEEEPIEDTKQNLESQEINDDEYLNPPVLDTASSKASIPVVAPAPVEEEPTELVIRAERMPCLDKCTVIELESERRKCTEEALLSFIYSQLKYPRIAKQNNLEGRVVVSFVVNSTGNVTDIKTLRDIGGGCGLAVEEVLAQLPKWSPGKQNGRPVHVQYTIPIKFTLE